MLQEYIQQLDRVEADARARWIPVILDDSKDRLIAEIVTSKPKRILEIGTAIGYSGTLMLLHCAATLDTIELDKMRYDEAKDNFARFGVSERVTQFLGDAHEILPTLVGNHYDFIFIDGPKSKYLEHFDTMIGSLEVGGMVFADNVLFRGMVRSEEEPPRKYRTIVKKLREFLARIESDNTLSATIYETGDGIAIIKKLA